MQSAMCFNHLAFAISVWVVEFSAVKEFSQGKSFGDLVSDRPSLKWFRFGQVRWSYMENWCFSVYIGNLWNCLCCFFQTYVYQVQLMCQDWWTSHVLSHWCSMLFVFFESSPRWWITGKISFVLHLKHMYICTLLKKRAFFSRAALRQRSPFTLRLPDLWVRPDDKAGSFCWVEGLALKMWNASLVKSCDTVDGRNPAPADMVHIPIVYRVSYILGGAGFLPSTVW